MCGLKKKKYGNNFRRADRVFGPRLCAECGPTDILSTSIRPIWRTEFLVLEKNCMCLHSTQTSSPISWRDAEPRSSVVRLRDCPGGCPGVLARLGQSHLHHPVRSLGYGRNSSSLHALSTGQCSGIPCSTIITLMHL